MKGGDMRGGQAWRWANEYAPVAFVIGACVTIPVGGVAFGVVGALATEVAAKQTADQALGWLRRRLSGEPDQINHDLQAAMRRGYVRAIDHLAGLWKNTHQHDARQSGGVDSAELFAVLKEDAAIILSDARISALAGNAEAIQSLGSANNLNRFLAGYFHGHGDQVERFLKETLAANIALFFGEELKADTAAWRAFQRLVTDSMIAGFERVEASQTELKAVQAALLRELTAIKELLAADEAASSASARRGLDQAIAAAQDLAKQAIAAVVEQGVLTRAAIEESTTLIVDRMSDSERQIIAHIDLSFARWLESAGAKAVAADRPALPIFELGGRQANQYFTGRETQLEAIATGFFAPRTDSGAVRIQALHGLGGTGKSQLAVEYARRNRTRYAGVCWLHAEQAGTLFSGFVALASRLKLPESRIDDPQAAVDAALRYLNGTAPDERWLLVFDNATGAGDLHPYLPGDGNIDVLITSRRSTWDGSRPIGRIAVPPFDGPEASDFLIRRTSENDREAAEALAEELGNLPLALEQAGAFIVQSEGRHTLAGYLGAFRKSPIRALAGHAPAAGNYDRTVATTWSISIEAIEQKMPAAVDLLRLCAFFAPDEIPLDIVIEEAELLPEPLQSALYDPWLDVKYLLSSYSLITLDDERNISIHRLVQEVVRNELRTKPAPDADREWCEYAAEVLYSAFPAGLDNPTTWPSGLRLEPHAIAVAGHAEERGVALEAVGFLLNATAYLLGELGRYQSARELYEQELALLRRVLPGEHPDIALSLNNLASVLYGQGDLERARELHEEGLALRRRVLPAEHPAIAQSLNNLATVRHAQGEFERARELYEEALTMLRRVLPGEHPNIAVCLGNLAVVLRELGEVDKAAEHKAEARRIGDSEVD